MWSILTKVLQVRIVKKWLETFLSRQRQILLQLLLLITRFCVINLYLNFTHGPHLEWMKVWKNRPGVFDPHFIKNLENWSKHYKMCVLMSWSWQTHRNRSFRSHLRQPERSLNHFSIFQVFSSPNWSPHHRFNPPHDIAQFVLCDDGDDDDDGDDQTHLKDDVV